MSPRLLRLALAEIWPDGEYFDWAAMANRGIGRRAYFDGLIRRGR